MPTELTLDRKENDKGYSPDNCRWATRQVQDRNKRSNRFVTHNGETLTITEWAKKAGKKPHTLRQRIIQLGWPIEKALSVP